MKWSDINDDDLNADDMQGFVTTDGDIKTSVTFAETQEGTVKIITRFKVEHHIVRCSRTNDKLLEKLRQNVSVALEKKSFLCDKCFIDIPRHLRKIDLDNDDIGDYTKDISGTLPMLRRDIIKDKFNQIQLFASGKHVISVDDTMPKRLDEREDADPSSNKYVAPRNRLISKDDSTVRVTNLSEETKEADLEDLFGRIGKVLRIYLAKDKETKSSKGFAFITYEDRRSAEKAIRTLDRHGYDNLLLKVEWAKPTVKPRD